MSVVLFVDLLGARKRWEMGGAEASRAAFGHFSSMVNAAARTQPSELIRSGGVETDSAMLVCETTLTAIEIARSLFRWAFRNPENPTAVRTWLRGSLVPHDGHDFLRRATPMRPPLQTIVAHTYSEAAFHAMSIEKAGFKGMRLLVHDDVVDQATRDALRITFGQRTLIPFRKLRHSQYPVGQESQLQDFLWMATQDDQEFDNLCIHMTSRLRHAARDSEEFAQAAATQVVFHECAAIRHTVRSRGLHPKVRRAAGN